MTNIEDRILQYLPDNSPLVVPADKVISIEPYLPEPELATITPFPLQDHVEVEDELQEDTDTEQIRRERQLFAPIKAAQAAFQHIQLHVAPSEVEEVERWQKTALVSKGNDSGELPRGLTRDELWSLVKAGQASLFDIAQDNEKLVKYVIRNLPISPEDMEDVFNTGYMGLLDAVASFTPGKGAKFSSWAMMKIRGAIVDDFRKNAPIPRSIVERAKRIALIENELAQSLGRMPTLSEVAQAGDMDIKKVREVKRLASTTVISSDNEDEEGYNLGSRLADEMDVSRDFTRGEMNEHVAKIIDELPGGKLSRVYDMYYRKGMSMALIAKEFGVSESRISQYHSRLLKVMRAALLQQGVMEDTDFGFVPKVVTPKDKGNRLSISKSEIQEEREPLVTNRYAQDTEISKTVRTTESLWSQLTSREQSFIAPLSYGFDRLDTIRRLSAIYKMSRADIGREMHKTIKRLQSLSRDVF